VVANVLAAVLWYLRGDWKDSALADPLQGQANVAAQLKDNP
jgi:hypothetical protein